MAVKKQSGATVKKTKKEESSSEEEEEEQTTRGVKRKREKDSEKPAAKKKKATPSKKLKKKKKRDPKEPKKPISGYLRFCEEFRPQVHENLKTKDVKLVSKELGKMWKELDPKAKEEYNNAFKKENEVFLEVFKEYKANKSSSEEEEEEEEEEAKKTPKKKKKDPNAPKRPLTGYMLYSKEKRSEVVAENPQLKNADVARELGRRWKALSEADRASYSKNYKEQKQQYDADFKQYKEEHPSSDESSEEEPEVKTPSKTSKKKKDPNAPKGPPNSFNLYSSEIRQSVKDENPTLDHKEIAKIIGQKWKALSDTEKEKYTKEASSKKEAFMQEFKDYTANQKKQEKIEKIEKKTKKTASTSSTTTPVKRKKNNVIDDEDEDEESDEEESGEEESGEESGDSSSDSSDSDDE